MAQAFSEAETAFIQGSRRGSQSAVMVVTDGKPSFNFMTNEMVEQLDDKGIKRYFFVVNEEDLSSDSNQQWMAWASKPRNTNLVHVHGNWARLESDMDMWVDKALVKFCPDAHDASYGYAHIKDGGFCGNSLDTLELLSKNIRDAEECAALVSGASGQSFVLGVSFERGKCYKGSMDVNQTQWDEWEQNRKNPVCSLDGGWKSIVLFDFYAMKPLAQ